VTGTDVEGICVAIGTVGWMTGIDVGVCVAIVTGIDVEGT